MPNVLLTETCVRSCPYCFAKKHMAGSADRQMSWKNLLYILDLLDISNDKHISYLGGEPTLHPSFTDFVLYTLRRGFHVTVFTSGIMSAQKLDSLTRHLSDTTQEQLEFVCNLNHPSLSSDRESEAIHRFLRAFGPQTTVSYNIYRNDFDLSFVFEYIAKFSLCKHVRLGLAHPIPGRENVCIPAQHLSGMARRLVQFLPTFESQGIRLGLDCGVPLCLFSDAELGSLYRLSRGRLSFSCGPAIDIGPDMMVWACFPLSTVKKKSIYDFNSLDEAAEYFGKLQSDLKSEHGGVMESCKNCDMRKDDLCHAGCAAHLVQIN